MGTKQCIWEKIIFWGRILTYDNRQVSTLALKFHSRLLTSGSHFAVKEGFINLIQTIIGWYSDKKLHTLLPSHGLSTESHIHVSYLNIVKLIVDTAKEISKTWIRFPHRYVEEIIEKMTEMLTITTETQYSPLSMFGIVDMESHWLRDWLHGNMSRSIFYKNISKSRQFITVLINKITNYINQTKFEEYADNVKQMKMIVTKGSSIPVSHSVMKFVTFLNNVCFLSRLFKFKAGRKLIEDISAFLNSLSNLLMLKETATTPGKLLVKHLAPVYTFEHVQPIIGNIDINNIDSVHNALEILVKDDVLVHFGDKLIPLIMEIAAQHATDQVVKSKITLINSLLSASPKAAFSYGWLYPNQIKLPTASKCDIAMISNKFKNFAIAILTL